MQLTKMFASGAVVITSLLIAGCSNFSVQPEGQRGADVQKTALIRQPPSLDTLFAQDVSAGGGKVWAVSSFKHQNGTDYLLYCLGSSWGQAAGAGVRIAVDNLGKPWVVNSKGEIAWYDYSANWWYYPSRQPKVDGVVAQDIAVDCGGTIYLVSKNSLGDGNYVIYKSDGINPWTPLLTYYGKTIGGVRIGGDLHTPGVWMVQANGDMYRNNSDGSWSPNIKKAMDVSVNQADGLIYIISTEADNPGNKVYKTTNPTNYNSWQSTPMNGAYGAHGYTIGGDAVAGRCFIIRDDGRVARWSGSDWEIFWERR